MAETSSESGELGAGGATEVLQRFERQRVTGFAKFHAEAGEAEVEFLSGMIVEARMEELSGRGALFRLLGLTEGHFELTPDAIAPRPALTPSLDRLLGELSQWHKLSEQAPALSSVPELSAAGREALERRALAEEQRVLLELADGQRTLAEIIDESGVDAVDALTLLVGAVQGGLLSINSVQASLYPLNAQSGVVAPIVSISAGSPASSSQPHAPLSAPVAYIPLTRKTLMTGTPIAGTPLASAPAHSGGAGAPGVHRIISIDSPAPPAPPAGQTHDVQAPPAARVPGMFGAEQPMGEGPATARFVAAFGTQTAASGPSESGPRRSSPYPPPSVGDLQIAPEVARVQDSTNSARYIGRYQILCRIGRGGMGSVYLCRLSSQGGFRRLFALKLLRKHLLADSAAARRFLDEARLAGHIHHPNVVSVVDAGFHASQPYLVMDYVEGGSLKDLLAAHASSRPPQLVLPIILDALAGLHSAHTLVGEDGTPLQIVHCDVSPENLLVGIDGVCRLTDFGVARHGSEPRDKDQITHGKPTYLAPEQIMSRPVDCRADVFAMGVVLYRALTGTRLFEGSTVEHTLQLVCKQRVDPPSTVGLQPPPCLDFVCMRALERDPERRFSSAHEMMMELRRIALRENLLAATSEVAAWVRESVGHDLTRRRLIVLEASQRSRPMSVQNPPPPQRPEQQQAFERRDSSDAPPPSSVQGSDSQQTSPTIALDPSQVPSGGSGMSPSARWALLGASVMAVIAVLVTVLWPGLVSRMFRIPTDAVGDDIGRTEEAQVPDSPAPRAPRSAPSNQ
jgi:serine/threonine protein kinase